jgi:hypothetical protein
MTIRTRSLRLGIHLALVCAALSIGAWAQEPPPQQYPPQQYPPQQYPPQQYPPQQYPPQQYPPQQYPPQQYPPQQYPPQQYPPQQYPPQQYPPQQYPPQQQPAATTATPVPHDEPVPARRPARPRDDLGKMVNLRFGWNAYGAGTVTFEGDCSGDCPVAVTNGHSDTTDRTRILLGLDMLFGRAPLQLGFGLWFMPHVTLDAETGVVGSTEKDLGWEFTTPLIVGAVLPLNEQLSLSLRGFVGPQVLFGGGGGAIEQDADAYEGFCDSTSLTLEECDAGAETRLGLTPGVAGGVLLGAGPLVSMSADVMLQYTNIELFSFEAAGNGWSAQQSYGYEGLRLWLVLGVGLGG